MAGLQAAPRERDGEIALRSIVPPEISLKIFGMRTRMVMVMTSMTMVQMMMVWMMMLRMITVRMMMLSPLILF